MKIFKYNILRKMNFSTKILLCYTPLFILFAVLAWYFFYRVDFDSLANQSLNLINHRALIDSKSIEAKVVNYTNLSDYISKNNVVSGTLNESALNDSEFILNIRNNFAPFCDMAEASQEGIVSLLFYTSNEFLYDHYRFSPITDEVNILVGEGNSQNNYYSDLSTQEDKLIYTILYPSNYYNKFGKSYLEIKIDANYLINDIVQSQSDMEYTIITDADGNIVNNNFDTENNRKIIETVLKEDIKEDLTLKSKIIQSENGKFYANYIEIINSDILLFSVVNEEYILNLTNEKAQDYVFYAVITIVIASGISYLISFLLMRKLKKAVSAVRIIQSGNFDVALEVKGQDEIDELSTDINIMSVHIKELIDEIYTFELAQKEATIRSLQSQMNPHFLFNALETIRMMIQETDDETSEAIVEIGNLLRYNINYDENTILLSKEIEHIKSYQKIQNLILNNNLQINYNIHDELDDIQIPKLIIQPVVENAVKYGYSRKVRPFVIDIETKTENDYLVIIVTNNGNEISQERFKEVKEALLDWKTDDKLNKSSENSGNGIAITNVNKRLKLRYGEECGLSIFNDNHKFRVELKLKNSSPYHKLDMRGDC